MTALTASYDRTGLTTGVVHLGVGAFHRAHLAMYHDRLLERGVTDWAICGVGVLPADRPVRDAARAQDGLYTLVLKHPDGTYEPRVIGSITDYLFAPEDPDAVVERMADPSTRIVSLTITEGGYVAGSPAFDLIVRALAARRDRGLGGLTVLSCDNLEGNGDRTRAVLMRAARDHDGALADWIAGSVTCPNSMVDRITPRTTDDDRREVRDRFGVDDAWPVVCEPFVQWVVEDRFAAGRPEYDLVGAQIVDDVEPYELMKLRLLNASHQGLCYFAHLCGYELVHEAAQDPLFRRFLAAYMDAEATPTLPPVPGVDLDEYKRTLLERFANPEIRDTIARLCQDSSDRIPQWLLPVVRHNLDSGGDVFLSAAVVASWARYAEGVDEQGQAIAIDDPRAETLTELGRRARRDPIAFIADRELFGDLADHERFADAYGTALRSLQERGARATLEMIVDGTLAAVRA